MKYTSSYRERVILDDGARVQLRAIRPADKAALAEGFEQLSPESRRSRFHAAKTSLTEAELRFLTECDGDHHYAIVAAVEDDTDGTESGIGVARFVRTAEDPAVAELGITVVDAWQGRGVGGVLLKRIAAAAVERHVERFRAVIAADNEKVKHLIGRYTDNVIVRNEEGVTVIDCPITVSGGFDRTLQVLRQLTFGTMIVPLRIGEHTLRRLLDLSLGDNRSPPPGPEQQS